MCGMFWFGWTRLCLCLTIEFIHNYGVVCFGLAELNYVCGYIVFVFVFASLSGDGQGKPLGTVIRNAQVDMDVRNPLGTAIRNAQVGKEVDMEMIMKMSNPLGTAVRNA